MQCAIKSWEIQQARNTNRTKAVVDIWSDLFEMFKYINTGECSIANIEQSWYRKADCWIERFLEVHDGASIRIHIHILLAQGLDLFYRFRPLRNISNQGFEASNKRDITHFHHHTQRNGGNISDFEVDPSWSPTETLLQKRRERENRSLSTILIRPY